MTVKSKRAVLITVLAGAYWTTIDPRNFDWVGAAHIFVRPNRNNIVKLFGGDQ